MRHKGKHSKLYSREFINRIQTYLTIFSPNSVKKCVRRAGASASSMVLALAVTTLALNGCGAASDTEIIIGDNPKSVSSGRPPFDVVLISDLVRFYLDGDMEEERAFARCYNGVCTQGNADRLIYMDSTILDNFGNFAEEFEETGTETNTVEGIRMTEFTQTLGELEDIPGVATRRSITGYGGLGKHVGFSSVYLDFIRNERIQRMVMASLGGWGSVGNPQGPTYTWTGGAVGVDHSVITEHRILTGNSEINVSYYQPWESLTISVDITDMEDVNTGRKYDDMEWNNINLTDGVFKSVSIHGQFFGPNHEEVGGVFEKNEIIGAFGASRE